MLISVAAAAFLFLSAVAQDPSLEQAARLDSEQKCAEAEEIYNKAVAAHPATPAILNNFGNHYLACGSPDQARAVFENLLRLKPDHVNANLQLARLALSRNEPAKALSYLSHVAPAESNDPEIAIVHAEALARAGRRAAAASMAGLIAKKTNDPRTLYGLAMMCARTGFYSDAEDLFSRVLLQDPGDTDLLYNLGVAAAHAGHLAKARVSFEAVLKTKPSDADTLYELGRVETAAGDVNRAVYLLSQAMKNSPDRSDIALALARSAGIAGYYGDSLLAYDRYLVNHPEDQAVQRDRALVAGFTRNGLNDALAFLTNYVEKHPADAVGFYDLAQVSFRANRNNALAEVSRAIQLNAKLQPALFFRGWLLNQAGSYQESLRDASAAAALNQKDARAFDLIGLDNLDLEKPERAEQPLRKALALSPSEPDFLFHLGRCLLELGRRDDARPVLAEFQKLRQQWTPAPREEPGVIEAATLSAPELARHVVKDYREAVRMNPNEPALQFNLARALFASGHTEEALSTFRHLLEMAPPATLARDAGMALLQFEQYELARDFFKISSREIPRSNLELAVTLFFSDGPQAAVEASEHVPEPERRADFHVLRFVALNAMGKPPQGLTLTNGDNHPFASPRLVIEAALLLIRQTHPEQALTLIERGCRSAPQDPQLALARVTVLDVLKRTREAERAVREIEARWPQWNRPYAAEALLLRRSGNDAEAAKRLEIASTLGPNDTVTQCVRDYLMNRDSRSACSCASGIWSGLLAGCQ